MTWGVFYAIMALSATKPTIQSIPLPKQPYFEPYDDLGFIEFNGNKPQSPFTLNLIQNIKEGSCTFIQTDISITKKNNFHINTKILYFDLKYL